MNELTRITKGIEDGTGRLVELLTQSQAAEKRLAQLEREHYAARQGGVGAADKVNVDAAHVADLAKKINDARVLGMALDSELKEARGRRLDLERQRDKLQSEAAALVVSMNAALLPVLWACVTGPPSVEAAIGPMRERHRAIIG